ncbi:hypothetical protein DY000_02042304 [Brassica cretica]|uniref:Uncharacterized protein n=1 Tax=Brassica cretica TaxID=69181 RepID=A0ABQ7BKV0_BRACR|nr:hypothetical protein DY000_02042304 [Brassica cretica]
MKEKRREPITEWCSPFESEIIGNNCLIAVHAAGFDLVEENNHQTAEEEGNTAEEEKGHAPEESLGENSE